MEVPKKPQKSWTCTLCMQYLSYVQTCLNCSIANLLSLQKSLRCQIAGATNTDMSGLLQTLLVRIPKFDGTYMTPRHVCVMLKELSLVKPVMGWEMIIPMGTLFLEVITDNALKKWGKSRWKTRPPGATWVSKLGTAPRHQIKKKECCENFQQRKPIHGLFVEKSWRVWQLVLRVELAA